MRKNHLALFASLFFAIICAQAQVSPKKVKLTDKASQMLKGKKILLVERAQYAADHHNTETLFLYGEINTEKFEGGSELKIYDVDTKSYTKLLESPNGVIRDPELSYDATKVIFSMRHNKQDDYHIYEINIDGGGLKQLTFGYGVSDIDPLYLPDGGIVFSSTRQPKYCMCNRHIMANLYRMDNGGKVVQIGVSTLFEGHSAMLANGQILYDRWEYVDRNFGNAQGLWTVNPDGTKHAVYYGNNTKSPGGVIDARQIPGTDLIVCIFTSCHDRPWGALAVIDRKKGVDGVEPVVHIQPKSSLKLVGNGGHLDSFKYIEYFVEDPFPISQTFFLASQTIWIKKELKNRDSKSGIYLMGCDGTNELLLEGTQSLFDPMLVEARAVPMVIPKMTIDGATTGNFYVQNVYEGTHMQGVEKGSAKYLRVVETPEKRTWTISAWGGEGEQAPGVNWHSFETKRILGEVAVEEDGSANFIAPAGKFVYFQLLDKDKKMIQSMRSGVSLMPGEVNGCIGCHEDRLSTVPMMPKRAIALRKKPMELTPWQGERPFNFSFAQHIQPILDRRCVKCHDFDPDNREKLVLAADKNMFFNAAYINLYVKKAVSLIGAGPADIQQAYSWGSHKSRLTQIIDAGHKGVRMTDKEREAIYTWLDLNGVYYPVYESSFDATLAGRSPLTNPETAELSALTGVNFKALNKWSRKVMAQVSFDRPSKSPCLDSIRDDKAKYNRALELITLGGKRLKQTPRGDIESELVVAERLKNQLKKSEQMEKMRCE